MVRLATICYIDNGKEILMLHRNLDPNDQHYDKWIGVGGKFEVDETPEECARREIKEETGLDVLQMELRGIITFPEFTPGHTWYTYMFHVTDYQGDLIDCDEGTLHWVPYEKLLDLPTWEGDYQFMRWLLNGSPFFSASFSYEDQQLIDQEVIFYGENRKGLLQ